MYGTECAFRHKVFYIVVPHCMQFLWNILIDFVFYSRNVFSCGDIYKPEMIW